MSRQTSQEELAKQYLLGTLSDEERARMEERYFSDDAEFEEVEIAEDELIDRYVRGELSETDRNRFETTLAGLPRLAERVHFARMWKEKLANSPADSIAASRVESQDAGGRQTSWWSNLFGSRRESRAPRLAVAFSVLLILVGGTALLAGWLRLREQSRQLAAQQAALEQRQRELDRQAADLKTQADQLANQSPQPSPTLDPGPKQVEEKTQPIAQSIFAIALSPGTTRSGTAGKRDFVIPQGTTNVRLTLAVRDTDYPSYRATLVTPEGNQVVPSATLRLQRARSGAALTFVVRANRLSPGDYVVRVVGLTAAGASEGVADYAFRITK